LFKETLVGNDNVNFVEIDAFLLDDEKDSLLNRITVLESGLATARDHDVLRLSFDWEELGLNCPPGLEETGSWWQTCKGWLGRAWAQLYSPGLAG
jgi:hypothetical protein